jgi:ABC-type transport system substrate-binding protein
MKTTGFWERVTSQRITRRRTLVATGAGALGAAFLAACGGGDSGGTKTKEEASSLVAKPEDTTKQAKRGGALKFHVAADIPNFDPHSLSLANREQVLLNYNRLTRVKPGLLQSSDGTIIGDALDSWEFSPDKLTVTMKIRNLGTPQVAPINGRVMDSSDILYSWERWVKNGTNRADLANSVNPNAPVLSMTAPDAKTVVVKLKAPLSSIMAGFSNFASGNYYVIPKEAESQIDLRRSPMGAGVYYLAEYVPSSRFVFKRNPGYYDKNVAFVDQVDIAIVSENATGLAQLKAGGLFTYPVVADSIIQTKNDAPDINLYQTEIGSFGTHVFFGFKTGPTEKMPFRDVRVRQAYSMSMDRDTFTDVWGNVSKFASQGVPVDSAWNAAVPATAFKGWPLDPRSKDFGPNSQFYQRNLAESKKLLTAAGYASGLNVTANQIGGPDYGPNYAKYIEVLEGFAGEAGFKFTKAIQSYTTNWAPEFRDSHGFFEGVAYRAFPQASDPGDQLYAEYNKGGSVYYGFDPDGKGIGAKEGPYIGDPTCDDLTNKIRTEFDDAKRKSLGQELQRYLGKMQYQVGYVGAATGFQLAWPAVRNWRMLSGNDSSQTWASYWIDDTQAPLKKA